MGYIVCTNGRVTEILEKEAPGAILIGSLDFQAVSENPESWAWLNGRLVYSPKPTNYHEWVDNAWVFSQTILDDARAHIWEMIKEYRAERIAVGVLVNGYWFHTDLLSMLQHLGLKDDARDILAAGGLATDVIHVTIAGLGSVPLQWKTMSGVKVFMTCQLAMDIVEADKVIQATVFAVGEMHKTAVYESTDPWAHDFTTDWPLGYGEV